ncbi:MAG: septum formation initiator family protein [Mariprofundus sp.]
MVKHIGRWLLWIIGAAIVAYMSWILVFSDHGYLVYRQEAVELQKLREQVAQLKLQREALAQKILHLRNDPDALEVLIHRDLGYVYPDEFMLIMPEKAVVSGQ